MKSCFILVANYKYHEVSGSSTRVYKHGYPSEEEAKKHIPELTEKIKVLDGVATPDPASIEIRVVEIELEQ